MVAEIIEFKGKTDKNGNTARLQSRQLAKWSKHINGSALKKPKSKEVKRLW